MHYCERDCNENQGRNRCPTCPEPNFVGRAFYRLVWGVVVLAALFAVAGCGGGGDTGAEPERTAFPDKGIEPSRDVLCGADGSGCK